MGHQELCQNTKLPKTHYSFSLGLLSPIGERRNWIAQKVKRSEYFFSKKLCIFFLNAGQCLRLLNKMLKKYSWKIEIATHSYSCMAHMCFKGNTVCNNALWVHKGPGAGGASQRLKSAACQGFTSLLDCSDGDWELDKMKKLRWLVNLEYPLAWAKQGQMWKLTFFQFSKKRYPASHRENKIIYTFAIFFLSALLAIGVQWRSYLLVPGHWIHQLHIKLWIILSKRLIAVVVNEFHDWVKR